MPWRNNGQQQSVSWRTEGRNEAGSCHYGHWARDWYSRFMRRRAVARLLPRVRNLESIVDIGCGNGEWLGWLKDRLPDIHPVGVDLADFGADDHWPIHKMDMEALKFRDGTFDMGLIVTALAHTENPQRALEEATRVCRRYLLILEFMLDPPPDWAWRLRHRVPIPYYWLVARMNELGWEAIGREGCGAIDGAIFTRVPRFLWPVVAPITTLLDIALSGIAADSKYQAVLFQRRTN